MRRALSLAVALVAVSAVPAQAHDSLTAARLGAEVQVALRTAGIQPASPAARVTGPRALKPAIMPIQLNLPGAVLPTTAQIVDSVAQLNAIHAATTGGKLKATAVIAPVYTTTAAELFRSTRTRCSPRPSPPPLRITSRSAGRLRSGSHPPSVCRCRAGGATASSGCSSRPCTTPSADDSRGRAAIG